MYNKYCFTKICNLWGVPPDVPVNWPMCIYSSPMLSPGILFWCSSSWLLLLLCLSMYVYISSNNQWLWFGDKIDWIWTHRADLLYLVLITCVDLRFLVNTCLFNFIFMSWSFSIIHCTSVRCCIWWCLYHTIKGIYSKLLLDVSHSLICFLKRA